MDSVRKFNEGRIQLIMSSSSSAGLHTELFFLLIIRFIFCVTAHVVAFKDNLSVWCNAMISSLSSPTFLLFASFSRPETDEESLQRLGEKASVLNLGKRELNSFTSSFLPLTCVRSSSRGEAHLSSGIKRCRSQLAAPPLDSCEWKSSIFCCSCCRAAKISLSSSSASRFSFALLFWNQVIT